MNEKRITSLLMLVFLSLGLFNVIILSNTTIISPDPQNQATQLTKYQNISNNQQNNVNSFARGVKTQTAIQNELNTKSISFLYSQTSKTHITGFISTWNTSLPGISGSTGIKLPLVSTGTYNFNVSWGDNQSNIIVTGNYTLANHIYSTAGVYTVNITGTIKGWEFNNRDDARKIIGISNWGPLQFGNTGYYFSGANNLVLTAIDAPNLTSTTILDGAFYYCYNLGNIGNMSLWNTSTITSMKDMFLSATSFNQYIGSWNVSSVTDMTYMFSGDSSFNQSLASWDVSKVFNMNSMFSGDTSFNQPLASWNVSHVTGMSFMFSVDYVFNQSLAGWDVSHVTDMQYMFSSARSFNQPLASWNVSQVTNMYGMFSGASSFNQPLASWDVSQVTNMDSMFFEAYSFNQPLASWNVSSVTDMTNFLAIPSSFSSTNYDNLLINWSNRPLLQSGVTFGVGSVTYDSVAASAREKLINIFGWSISDGGLTGAQTTSTSYPQQTTSYTFGSATINSGEFFGVIAIIIFILLIGGGFFAYKTYNTNKTNRFNNRDDQNKQNNSYNASKINQVVNNYCPSCGYLSEKNDIFCQNCGNQL